MKQFTNRVNILIAFLSVIPLGVYAEGLQNTSLASNNQFTNIVELIVFAIISAALIISVLVLFLGRWAGRKEQKAINSIRRNAEVDKKNISSSVESIQQKETQTTNLVLAVKKLADEFSTTHKDVNEHAKSIIETSERIKQQEHDLVKTTNTISLRMDKIQAYWDSQLHNTVSTIQEVQTNLDKNLNKVDNDLAKMQQQKALSQELLQDFLGKHQEQSQIINSNFDITEKVGQNLEVTLSESTKLIDILKEHKVNAEKSVSKFTEELTNFEEQAYEQFDSSFQVADIARQELNANINESRSHIESMRRHEEQSHNINTQTQKNLETLDFSKIKKISNTLDSTQRMFSDIHTRVEDTKRLLDELKDIETDVRSSAHNINDNSELKSRDNQKETSSVKDDIDDKDLITNANVYKMASGGNTPLSFFTKIKKKKK